MSSTIIEHGNLVGGELLPALDGATRDIANPATGEVLGRVPEAGAADVVRAVAAAAEGRIAWRDTTPGTRQELLLAPAAGEYGDAHSSMVRREPPGIVGQIAPWNYPPPAGGRRSHTSEGPGPTDLRRAAARRNDRTYQSPKVGAGRVRAAGVVSTKRRLGRELFSVALREPAGGAARIPVTTSVGGLQMRKLVLIIAPAALLLATAAPVAAQEVAQPSQGEQSAGRNIHGTGFGPHCHVVVAASEHAPFPFISVMPSHRAHLSTNAALGASAVFQADPNCDGDPGA